MKLLDWLLGKPKPPAEDPWKETPEEKAHREELIYLFLKKFAEVKEKHSKNVKP